MAANSALTDKRGKNRGDKDKPSAGHIALLWGGEARRRWTHVLHGPSDASQGEG